LNILNLPIQRYVDAWERFRYFEKACGHSFGF
jgi:hypothetical protein